MKNLAYQFAKKILLPSVALGKLDHRSDASLLLQPVQLLAEVVQRLRDHLAV